MTQATDTDIRDIKTSIDDNTRAIYDLKYTVIQQTQILGFILFGIAGLMLGAYLQIADLLIKP